MPEALPQTQPMASASSAPSPPSFQQAFEQLLRLAPGPVFPRARRLYLNKYPLEGRPEAAAPARFLTFLLEEEIQEGDAGLLRIQAKRFALVHWQAPQTSPADYTTYLQNRWQLPALDLTLVDEPWFREGGACAHFRATAIFERTTAPMALLGLDQSPRS